MMKTCLQEGDGGGPRCECVSVCPCEGEMDVTPNREMDYCNLMMKIGRRLFVKKKKKRQILDQMDAFDSSIPITFYLVIARHRTLVAVVLILVK